MRLRLRLDRYTKRNIWKEQYYLLFRLIMFVDIDKHWMFKSIVQMIIIVLLGICQKVLKKTSSFPASPRNGRNTRRLFSVFKILSHTHARKKKAPSTEAGAPRKGREFCAISYCVLYLEGNGISFFVLSSLSHKTDKRTRNCEIFIYFLLLQLFVYERGVYGKKGRERKNKWGTKFCQQSPF